jgi:hypothetical protein
MNKNPEKQILVFCAEFIKWTDLRLLRQAVIRGTTRPILTRSQHRALARLLELLPTGLHHRRPI